ncbi:uncharacterized protein LOC108632722 [Ceratina calcarata]|uniref:Uncharacterized protein LOC108632722 n=1 Tax=Ceratina calcarata TaxID=156304 RepID=A0AAJ7RVI9_9HYME|nr:uncharacterized protein LOC108632722 [Ceratina calcarata]
MCFYLNYEIWKTETDNTIKQLYQVSSRMKEQLLEASEVQGTMLQSQKESLKMQNQLLDHGKELGTVLRSSSESVNIMVKDFNDKESLISTTWMYRKIALSLCAITLFCTYYYYKDEHVENYKALKRIEHKLNSIQEVTAVSTNHRYYTRLQVKRLKAETNKEIKE